MRSSARSPDDSGSRSGDQQDGSHEGGPGEMSDEVQGSSDGRGWSRSGVVMFGEINNEGNPSHTQKGRDTLKGGSEDRHNRN